MPVPARRSVVRRSEENGRGRCCPRLTVLLRGDTANVPSTPDRDPFDGLVLDEEFVRAARKREPSGADRAGRAASLRARLAAEEVERRHANRWHRRAGRRVRRMLPAPRTAVVFVVLAAVIGVLWWDSNANGGVWVGGDPTTRHVDPTLRPTPTPPPSAFPLGDPIDAPAGGGAHKFTRTQPGSSAPVTYDPCRPIRVVMNERLMPPAAGGLVAEAPDEVSAIVGLKFIVEGPTDEPPSVAREPFQPDRYGDRWVPVLIAWSDATGHAPLTGDVAGVGGSQAISVAPEQSVYVTGAVTLDVDSFERILPRDDGWGQAKAIVLHELGHLLGLDHVEDHEQIMHSRNSGQTGFAYGDLAGLVALGRGACIPEL